MACKDCENGNPITPVYSDAIYVLNKNCASSECPSIYVPPDGGISGGRTTELIAGTDILIEDFSDASVDRFKVSYNPFIALTASLQILGYSGGAQKIGTILKGTIIDEIRSSWSYNKGVISSQTLNTIPVTPPNERALIETGLNVTDDITYNLQGDDGQGQAGSIANASDQLLFGNYQIWGDYTQMLGQPASAINTLIANLANKNQSIKRSRGNTIYATGGAGRYFFVIYPAAWGEGTFFKDPFVGGFQRLKNDGGTLVVTPAGAEIPIEWTNEEGYTEEIYVYQSLYDNTEDAVTPIIIS